MCTHCLTNSTTDRTSVSHRRGPNSGSSARMPQRAIERSTDHERDDDEPVVLVLQDAEGTSRRQEQGDASPYCP